MRPGFQLSPKRSCCHHGQIQAIQERRRRYRPAGEEESLRIGQTKFTQADHRKLKKLRLLTDETAMQIPEDEMIPTPPEGWRVIFLDFLTRGLSLPVQEFLCFLLFVYGIQLYQLTPNSILHISVFITLCECFLGIHPHWGLWKRIFLPPAQRITRLHL